MSQSAFEFYKMVVALGDREDTDYRDTFFLFLKVHTSAIAGYCALAAYALTEKHSQLFMIVAFVALFATLHSNSWRRQNATHATWNAHWRAMAADIERTVEFRRAVGMDKISLWSHPRVAPATNVVGKSTGTTAKSHTTLIDGLMCLHGAAALTSLIYVVAR